MRLYRQEGIEIFALGFFTQWRRKSLYLRFVEFVTSKMFYVKRSSLPLEIVERDVCHSDGISAGWTGNRELIRSRAFMECLLLAGMLACGFRLINYSLSLWRAGATKRRCVGSEFQSTRVFTGFLSHLGFLLYADHLCVHCET